MIYYLVYGVIVSIGVFFVYYFVFGDRMALAQEITKIVISLGFFILLLISYVVSNKQKYKKVKHEGGLDESITYINNKTKRIDKLVSFLLVIVVLSLAYFYGDFDLLDIFQAIFILVVFICWRTYLFASRKLESYETISGLSYTDQMQDYLILLLTSIVFVTLPVLGKIFNSADIAQVFSVFFISYLWHRYLFTRRVK